jgi:hypothetical protein
MKQFLRFDDVEHNDYGAKYAIDWQKGERKYKTPMHGLRVYEGGMIEVTQVGYNRPEWRVEMERRYGICFKLMSQMTHVTFHTCDTDEKVLKLHVSNKIVMHEQKLGRIYGCEIWGSAFQFISEHAQPIGTHPVSFRIPNKEKERSRYQELEEYFALGRTLNALNAHKQSYNPFGYFTIKYLERKEPLPTDLTTTEAQIFCKSIAANENTVRVIVTKDCADIFTTPYLNIKEK